MKNLQRLALCLAGSALILSACAKDDTAGTTGPSTGPSSTTENNDTDPGETGDDETTGANETMTTFGNEEGDGDGDGDDTTTTTTMGFVPDEDFATVSECDPWAQDCPDGEKCVAYGSTGGNWDANKCVQVLGDGQQGDPCMYGGTVESTDDCGDDTWCWNVNMDGVGTCTPFCTGTPDDPVCEPGYGCSIANNGSINICLLSCDPLLQDCEGDNVCYYDFSGNFVCAFAADMIPAGEPCGFINDCAPGTVCLGSEVFPMCGGASCCGEFCDLSDPTCTLADTECTPFFEEGTAPPEYEDIGVCIIPGA